MDLFCIDVTLNEMTFIRQSLEMVNISGKDAKFLANLQTKLENEIVEVQRAMQKEEAKKAQELNQVIASEQSKLSKAK